MFNRGAMNLVANAGLVFSVLVIPLFRMNKLAHIEAVHTISLMGKTGSIKQQSGFSGVVVVATGLSGETIISIVIIGYVTDGVSFYNKSNKGGPNNLAPLYLKWRNWEGDHLEGTGFYAHKHSLNVHFPTGMHRCGDRTGY